MASNVRLHPGLRALAALAALAACAEPPRPVGAERPGPVVIGFTATVDPARGTLDIVPDAAGGSGTALLAELPAVKDGVAGSGPRDTVELVNAAPPTIAAGCGAQSYEADVTLRSFYANARLERAHVEIVQMSATGREACNSVEPVEDLGAAYGLWSYGTIRPARQPGDAATVRWTLRLPDATAFTFRGRVVADVVPDDSVVAVSRGGSATLVNRGVAYDAAGNGLAVWNASTGAGQRLLYAYFSAAAGTWSAPGTLATEATTETAYGIPAKVASNGTTFLVVWSTLTGVDAALFTAGTPGGTRALWPGNAILDAFDVTANAGRYAVVRAIAAGGVQAYLHDGAGWSWASLMGTGPAQSVSVAPWGTSGFVTAFRFDSSSVYTVRHDGTAWGAPGGVPGASGTPTALVGPALATSGIRVAVAWAPVNGTVQVNVDPGDGFRAAGVTEIGALAGPPTALSAAGNGGDFAVVWTRAGGGAFGSVLTGSTWWGPWELGASGAKAHAAKVAPSGGGFTAALTLGESGWAAPSLWLNETVVEGLHLRFDAARAVRAESGAGDARDPLLARRGSGVAVSWDQEDGIRPGVHVRAYAAGSAGEPETPSRPLEGSVRQVRLARARAGEVLAVWTQDHRGGPAVFAAVHVDAGWGVPVLLDLNAHSPAIASDGQGFMVAYARLDAGTTSATPVSNVVVRRFADGAFEPAAVLSDGYLPAVASDRSSYAVVFTRGAGGSGGVWRAVLVPGVPPSVAQFYSTGTRFSNATVVGRPGEYAAAWYASAPTPSAQAARAWSGAWGSTFNLQGGTIGAGPLLASGPGGFAAIWRAGGSVGARLTAGGASWDAATLLASSGSGAVALASDETSFLAAYETPSGVSVRTSAGASWAAGARVEGPTLGFAIAGAGGGGGYALALVEADGATTSLSAMDPLRDAPDTAWPLELSADAVRPDLALVHDGERWVAAWTAATADPIVDALRARPF